jgi:hypothetical protein
MHSLCCFQTIHGTRRATEASPLCIAFGVRRLALHHQSVSVASPSGGRQGMHSQASVLCHPCQARGHSSIRWWIVSSV